MECPLVLDKPHPPPSPSAHPHDCSRDLQSTQKYAADRPAVPSAIPPAPACHRCRAASDPAAEYSAVARAITLNRCAHPPPATPPPPRPPKSWPSPCACHDDL